MNPIKFPESNVIFAKDQPQYKQLPAYKEDSNSGKVITCWKLSFRERINLLFRGKLWISILTFNKPLNPILPSIQKPQITKEKLNEKST